MSTRWQRKSRRNLYRAKTPDEVSLVIDRIALPSGREFDYPHVDCGYEVTFIVGVDERRRVAMLRQFRYLVGQQLWEVPAGSPNVGENLEEGALREFEEETGYKATSLHRLASFYSSVGITNQMCHIFIAFNLVESTQALDESESIDVRWLPIQSAVELVTTGQVLNVGSAYAILLADRWLNETDPS